MTAFAFIDADGIPTGGGIQPVLPDGAVPLTAPFTTFDLPRLRFRNGVWKERNDLPAPAPPTKAQLAEIAAAELSRARADTATAINDLAGAFRKLIYTDIPGQDALYLEKRAEAVAYIRQTETAGEPNDLRDYPLIQNELGITAPTAWQLAQIWLHRSDLFKTVGADTERLRMIALAAVATAPDFAAIAQIELDFTQALSGLSI